MLLVGTKRLQDIIVQKSNLNFRMLQLNQKLTDLQRYAASLADGISLNDMMDAPASMFGRMSLFMAYSHQSAYQSAQQNMGLMLQSGSLNQVMSQCSDPAQQQAYQQLVFKNLYDQQREKFARAEEKIMNAQETKIQQELSQIKTRLDMLNAEEETTKKIVEQDAKAAAPQYA